MAWVYILKSLKNGSYYIGSTVDLNRRIIEHNSGKSKYTSSIIPLEIVFNQRYGSLKTARKIELKLKRYKSRKIIEQIIIDGFIKIKVA